MEFTEKDMIPMTFWGICVWTVCIHKSKYFNNFGTIVTENMRMPVFSMHSRAYDIVAWGVKTKIVKHIATRKMTLSEEPDVEIFQKKPSELMWILWGERDKTLVQFSCAWGWKSQLFDVSLLWSMS